MAYLNHRAVLVAAVEAVGRQCAGATSEAARRAILRSYLEGVRDAALRTELVDVALQTAAVQLLGSEIPPEVHKLARRADADLDAWLESRYLEHATGLPLGALAGTSEPEGEAPNGV